ncbi:hypothetical protein ACVXHB_08090 [Escherichia coli]
MVSMARPFFADAELLSKAQSGRADAISTCIGCNQACLESNSSLAKSPGATGESSRLPRNQNANPSRRAEKKSGGGRAGPARAGVCH